VHLLADRVVLLAELQQLRQAPLQQLELLAQRHGLALGERDGAAAVGMRHVDALEQLRMLLEELRMGAEEPRDVVCVHLPLLIVLWFPRTP
jgi:hypothetical protein